MLQFDSTGFSQWERFYRANFINSLSGFKPASLIGTVNQNGLTNLGVFSNIVHIGSDPALVGFINRPVKAAPHTIANIVSSGVYTINHIHPSIMQQAHQASARYPDNVSEFDETGLTPEYADQIAAPFVKESKVKFALALKEIIPIHLNNTSLVIGEIKHVILEDNILKTDGFIDIESAGSLCSSGIDAYYSATKNARYAYAKVNTALKEL